MHLVAHPKKPQLGSTKITKYDISGSGDITNLADYVMSIHRITDEDIERESSLEGKDAVIKIMKDRIKGTGEFSVLANFNRDRKRFYTNNYELNKSYGYTNSIDLVEVDTTMSNYFL